jgi:nucleotide-binding universal stress UspA family protein
MKLARWVSDGRQKRGWTLAGKSDGYASLVRADMSRLKMDTPVDCILRHCDWHDMDFIVVGRHMPTRRGPTGLR